MSIAAIEILSSLECYKIAPDQERDAAVREIVKRLGPTFSAAEVLGPLGLLTVEHLPTGARLAAIPGGSFEMGMSDEVLEEASEYVEFGYSTAEWVRKYQPLAQPAHRVSVRPFLIGLDMLTHQQLSLVLADEVFDDSEAWCTREVATRLAAATAPLRLPSEAEFEWVASVGGTQYFVNDGARICCETGAYPIENAWGLMHLHMPHWMADAWHDNYEGAPLDGSAWNEDRSLPGVVRQNLRPWGPEDDLQQLPFTLASFRRRYDDRYGPYAGVRFACALPE